MKILRLRTKNFRTLVDLDVTFDGSYVAICGANDSGKTNIVRALGSLLGPDDSPVHPFFGGMRDDISMRSDWPKWKGEPGDDDEVIVEADIVLEPQRDAGPHAFVLRQLGEESSDPLKICISLKVNKAGVEVRPVREVSRT